MVLLQSKYLNTCLLKFFMFPGKKSSFYFFCLNVIITHIYIYIVYRIYIYIVVVLNTLCIFLAENSTVSSSHPTVARGKTQMQLQLFFWVLAIDIRPWQGGAHHPCHQLEVHLWAKEIAYLPRAIALKNKKGQFFVGNRCIWGGTQFGTCPRLMMLGVTSLQIQQNWVLCFFFGRISQTEPRFGGSVGRLVAMNFQLSWFPNT